MTQLSDHTLPYEVLIRFDSDGKVQGAHFISRRIVAVDGKRIAETLSKAEPLSLALEGPYARTLAAVLGEIPAAALAALERAKVAAIQAQAERDKALEETRQARSAIERLDRLHKSTNEDMVRRGLGRSEDA
jgi:hypothetical protein